MDDLSTAKEERLPEGVELLDRDSVPGALSPDTDIVSRPAANSDVRRGADNPRVDLKQYTVSTSKILESTNERA